MKNKKNKNTHEMNELVYDYENNDWRADNTDNSA